VVRLEAALESPERFTEAQSLLEAFEAAWQRLGTALGDFCNLAPQAPQ